MAEEWYYAPEGSEKLGPLSAQSLASRFDRGSLDLETTLVWRRGMEKWEKAADIEDMIPVRIDDEPTAAEVVTSTPETTTATEIETETATPRSSPPLVRVKRSLFPLYIGLQIVGLWTLAAKTSPFVKDIQGLPFFDGIQKLVDNPAFLEAATPGALIFLLSVLLGAYIVHQAWTTLSRQTQRPTPLTAALLVLVPFFNLYWRFIAYRFWAQNWNRITADSKAPKMPERLFLFQAVSFILASIIPSLGTVALVLTWIATYYMCRATDYASEHGE